MPTGVHLGDARGLLFAAAERFLGRDGVSGLTSRAVTTEAGVAKGVLHRHFSDFDAFVAELLLDRVGQLEEQANRLRDLAGDASIVANLTRAIVLVFSPLVVAEVALVVTGDGLRARPRDARAPRLPLLSAAIALVDSYLSAEQDLGRIDPAADIAALSATLIGAVHLLFTDHESGSPDARRLQRTVEAVISGVITTATGRSPAPAPGPPEPIAGQHLTWTVARHRCRGSPSGMNGRSARKARTHPGSRSACGTACWSQLPSRPLSDRHGDEELSGLTGNLVALGGPGRLHEKAGWYGNVSADAK